ncbi:hypothetical protein [Cetobacterium sp.]|uniref:hypothetical protein n=1 Tax=Cetobacterium sp. TaxID=2071632 RepID=UPI003F2E6C91
MSGKKILCLTKYAELLDRYPNDCNYYNKKQNETENKFWIDLLKLSQERCFYCGESITIKTYDREHRIDKNIFDEDHMKKHENKYSETDKDLIKKITEELTKSKYNLIPCCKRCNGNKKIVDKEKVREKLLVEARQKNSILESPEDVHYFLDKNDFLDEKLDIDEITFHLKDNLLKSNQLEIKNKVIEAIENLMIKNWNHPSNYIEEILIEYNKSEYLETNYFLEWMIFE